MSAFDNSQIKKHQAEAKERWGRTSAYAQFEEKAAGRSEQKWNELAEGMDRIMAAFALCMRSGRTPDSREAQDLVKMLQDHITGNYYHCTNEILAGLGQMYVADERFRSNIDKHADGTAAFICEAIGVWCGR